jgi:hypothetical protein
MPAHADALSGMPKHSVPRAAATMNRTPCSTNNAAKPNAAGLMAAKCIHWYAMPVHSHIAARPPATKRSAVAERRQRLATMAMPSI